MTLDAEQEGGQLAVVSLVTSDGQPDVRESLLDRVDGGSLIVNLRAESDPDVLRRATEESLAEVFASPSDKTPIEWTVEHWEHFRPARPTPVHRITVPPALAGQP